MPVLITGATGFLGSRVLRELLPRGDDMVTVLGRGTPAELRARTERQLVRLGGPPLGPSDLKRLAYVTGDLTKDDLGLDGVARTRLADGLAEVWHCAADVSLPGNPGTVHRTNVCGTQRTLDLLDHAPGARLLHVSTTSVAGARRTGHVTEDDLTDAYGFESPYQASKYTAECAVRAWSAAHPDRTVTVLRPGVLTAGTTVPPGSTDQATGALPRLLDRALALAAWQVKLAVRLIAGTRRSPLHLRVPGDPGGHLNFVPVDYAVRAMVRAAAGHTGPGLRTLHVTHPQNTPNTLLASMLPEMTGIHVTLTPVLERPTPVETLVAKFGGHLLTYLRHRRTYDRTNLLRSVGDLPDPDPLDLAYLNRALAPRGAAARALQDLSAGAGPNGRTSPR
ncbi:hypothetical protein GCM10010211_75940 [Streptomyces albospinus]|uniref:Thioester reductase (TE) domain-containing protein n=1 Tax=Streptomyces albospinus TaxID=285515 RepID=A0ABQ2VMF5_9ACTN|nr:SDR family oxidoreductase [Streptomyces albospinus]GGU97453.1 hypothetical protein GCM10010211_75940 [Streptomyces albospinus]